jgi:hypothetical protein
MPEPIVLPPWGDDPLSDHMADAQHNTRAASLNWPDVYEVQQRAHGLLKRVGEIIEPEHGDSRNIGAARMLIFRSHAAILATMRLAMSGQAIEAMAVLRVAIEQGWYALHIASDPAPPTRARIWWNRDDSPQATQACKNEFTVAKVRGTHEALDPVTAAIVQRLYNDTITYGAHPNSSGIALGLSVEQLDAETATIRVGILNPIPMTMVSTIKAAVDVAMGLTMTVSLIYRDAFKRAGLGRDFNALRGHAADVFRARAEMLRREKADEADSACTRPE